MDEATAQRRIRASRLMKRIPELKGLLGSGKINLGLLDIAQSCAFREQLSDSDFVDLLNAIAGMSCRKAKREVTRKYPKSFELPPDRIDPLNDEYSIVSFVASEILLEKLDELKGLLAHSHPGMKMRELIELIAMDYYQRNHPEEKAKRAEQRAMQRTQETAKEEQGGAQRDSGSQVGQKDTSRQQFATELGEKEKEKLSEGVETPSTLMVPNEEKRTFSQAQTHALVRRDGYRCTYQDAVSGKRCQSVYGLQKDHVQSWSGGGKTSLENARYLCVQHHRRISYLEFGEISNRPPGK